MAAAVLNILAMFPVPSAAASAANRFFDPLLTSVMIAEHKFIKKSSQTAASYAAIQRGISCLGPEAPK